MQSSSEQARGTAGARPDGAPERQQGGHGWQAELALTFARRQGRTVIERRVHRGPLQIQRAFYPEGPALCHAYVLHPPGGIVAGDTVTLAARAREGAGVLLTTPAATKIYRGNGQSGARQTQRLEAAAGATLEWLPQETIVFSGGVARLETRVDLAGDARFVGWEILCLGRPAAAEPFGAGSCAQRLELYRDGRPLAIERMHIEAGGAMQRAPFGLRGRAVSATLLASPVPEGTIDDLRGLGAALPAEDLTSVTTVDGALVCRYLGDAADRARAHFERLWQAIRRATIGRDPTPPRIWLT